MASEALVDAGEGMGEALRVLVELPLGPPSVAHPGGVFVVVALGGVVAVHGVLGEGDGAEEGSEVAVGVGLVVEDGVDGLPGGGLEEAVDVEGVEAAVAADASGELLLLERGEAGDVGGDGAGGDAEGAGDLGAGVAPGGEVADLGEADADTQPVALGAISHRRWCAARRDRGVCRRARKRGSSGEGGGLSVGRGGGGGERGGGGYGSV